MQVSECRLDRHSSPRNPIRPRYTTSDGLYRNDPGGRVMNPRDNRCDGLRSRPLDRDGVPDGVVGDAQLLQDLPTVALLLLENTQEQMFGTDRGLFQSLGFLAGGEDRLLRVVGQG